MSDPCLVMQICRKSILGSDKINGTFYWCRSCLLCCGIVMKKNVGGCEEEEHYNAPGRICLLVNGK